MKSPRFIQCLKPDAAFHIDWRLSQGKDDVRLARCVELKVLRFSWFHHSVLVVLHHHKVLERGEVHSIRLILLSLLVVDLRDELALLHVGVKVERVMPILSLDKDLLDKVNVGAVVEEIPDNVTEEVHLSRALGEPKHSLVLSAKRDQVLHRGTRTPLSNSSKELTSLREPDGIVASGKLRVLGDHLAHLPDLPVRVPEEAAFGVSEQVAANHDPVDVDAGDVVLEDVGDPNHAGGAVAHSVPEHHRHRPSIIAVWILKKLN